MYVDRVTWITGAFLVTLSAVLAIPATLYLRQGIQQPVLTRFEVLTPPTDDPLSFAVSPDGRTLVFAADSDGISRLWVRPLDQIVASPLMGTDGASYPFWAPDNRTLGFFADGKLKRLDTTGGEKTDRKSTRLNSSHLP